MKPLVGSVLIFFFFLSSASLFECVLSMKQSSPPGWVVMNDLRKVSLGLFGLSLSSFKCFWLLFTMEVCSMYVLRGAWSFLLQPISCHPFSSVPFHLSSSLRGREEC